MEPLESRRLFAAQATVDVGQLVFNDPVGGAASAARTVTLRNTGTSSLSIPAGGISISGSSAGQFRLLTGGPSTVAPGGTLKVNVAFAPTLLGPEGATLAIHSNAANAPVLNVTLRGLGTKGLQGANEPSLQWILDTYQIPVRVGDSNPAESTLDLPAKTPNDEVVAQMFRKAGSGAVTLTPIAVFSNTASPGMIAGRYTVSASGTVTKAQLFTTPSADVQTLNPRVQGSTTFDPGTGTFGLYTTWPAQGNRTIYSEDFRNTYISPASHRRLFRSYPLKTAAGAVVPNAYVIGNEEALNNDLQDGVFIIRNVVPLAAGQSSPASPPPTSPPPVAGTVYQAESAVLSGAIRSSADGGFTGSGYADYTNASGDYVRWSVTNQTAGTRTISVRYANGGTTDRPLELRVNGVVVQSRVSFASTGSWTTWRTVSLTVNLNSGVNTVQFTAIGASGANLDSLTLV
jgi:hypothetical protein